MIELTPEQLREVQRTELELLAEVRRICDQHGIPYVIIAGTLLGAVRHQGFIPWDDDADVAMLRPDYERFRRICEKELDPERFVFQDDRCAKGYRWGYGKLRRKGTEFLREFQEDMPYFQGIFIDIFPMDPVPENALLRAAVDRECFLIRKFLWARVGKKADKNPVKRFLYRLMDRVPEEKILGAYHGLVRRMQRYGNSSWVRILMFPTPNNARGYRRKWYEKRRQYRFENEWFSGIRSAKAYLTFKFGDYLTLPPEAERKTHPVSRLVLLSDGKEETK